jgi:2-aminoethylphosphonate-pyruvate transaminase
MDIPYLLTPGPLTTSATVKAAMLRDWGSRDEEFIKMNDDVRDRLTALVGGEGTHVCVPLQGSGTFVVEATLATLVPREGKLLVLVNGAYGRRMVDMCHVMGRVVESIEWPEDEQVDPRVLDERLERDPRISHVALVHCETTSGILNPLDDVAEVTARHHRRLIVDAMSTFGALDVDTRRLTVAAIAASSNKCLQGVPGVGFALIERETLESCRGNAHSLSLDLYAQWKGFEQNHQWRFTPPTHVIAALSRALDEHTGEGGVEGRGQRYAHNHRILVEGMEALGFRCLLDQSVQAPIIVTFLMPADPNFRFDRFYRLLADAGFLIYPGKLTVADSFRIGCIGDLGEHEMRAALIAVESALTTMNVTSGSPAR